MNGKLKKLWNGSRVRGEQITNKNFGLGGDIPEIRQSEFPGSGDNRREFTFEPSRFRAGSDFFRRCGKSLEHHPRGIEADGDSSFLSRRGRRGVGNL